MDKRLGFGPGAFAFGEARQRPCRAVRNAPNGLWRIKEVSASGPPLKKAMRDGLSQTHEAGRLNHHRPIRGFVRHEPSVFQKDGGPADIQAALLHSLPSIHASHKPPSPCPAPRPCPCPCPPAVR